MIVKKILDAMVMRDHVVIVRKEDDPLWIQSEVHLLQHPLSQHALSDALGKPQQLLLRERLPLDMEVHQAS